MEKPTTEDFSLPIGWDLINDVSSISENEDVINEYLLHRLDRGLTYTWVGPILLSLNPEQNISLDLYHTSKYKDFFNASEVLQKDVQPHVFSVAARSHYKLLHGLGRPSQVILISGDSGSGKTFNANQAISFLSAINENSPALPLHGKKVEEFVGKIISACPLITAFSTASTVKNSRSSRHGQLIRFEYENGIVSGASIQSFLLERSRVTRGSDNFAIFYQLISGFPDLELEKLGLSKQETYNLMGTNPYIQKGELGQDFQETLNAMRTIGFSEDERDEILKVVALLIHLGNIRFKQSSGDGCSAVDTENEESRKALENACTLTSLPENDLCELITTSLISTQSQWRRHSTYRRNLGSIEICRNRLSSIIRHLYDNLFHWLIDRINQTLSTGGEHHSWLGIIFFQLSNLYHSRKMQGKFLYNFLEEAIGFVGILDIFGFESFAVNGIEELAINYANERLQLYFMQEYLESGRRDLWEEGLSELQTPETINIYRDRLSIIEINLFSTLNDANQCPVKCNILQLKDRFLTPSSCPFLKHSQKDEAFIISHYSQPVEYSLQDLLSKNIDKVPSELTSAFTTCSNRLLQYLSATNEDPVNQGNKIYARKGTTLAKVKRSLDALLRELKKCDTHYVKCIRPRRFEGSWGKNEFREQLACTGVLDALPLARCKFPIRLSYNEFNNRYSKKPVDIPQNHQRCKAILEEIADEETLSLSVYFGKRLIFLEESFFFKLENQRKEYHSQCAIKIQKFWKNYQLQKALDLNTRAKQFSFIDCAIEKSLSSDERSQANPSDYENEAFMSINNKDTSSGVDLRDFLPDGSESNSNGPGIKPEENIQSQISISQEDRFCEDFQSKFYSDLKTNSNLCSKVRRFKTIFVSQWVDKVSTTKGKEGISRVMQATKEMNERRKLQILRIRNCLHIQTNQNGNGYIVSFGNNTFFYKNRILSRQRLAEAPVRFHTRLTCLSNSHRLPRSELPSGLEDCL